MRFSADLSCHWRGRAVGAMGTIPQMHRRLLCLESYTAGASKMVPKCKQITSHVAILAIGHGRSRRKQNQANVAHSLGDQGCGGPRASYYSFPANEIVSLAEKKKQQKSQSGRRKHKLDKPHSAFDKLLVKIILRWVPTSRPVHVHRQSSEHGGQGSLGIQGPTCFGSLRPLLLFLVQHEAPQQWNAQPPYSF